MNEDSLPSTSAGTIGTTSTLASCDRILSVKSSIDGIDWNGRLEDLVNIIHATTTQTYSLSRFIFLCTLQDDGNFDIAAYISKEFFSKVRLSSVSYRHGRVGEAIFRRRTFIDQRIQRYLDHTTYERPELKYTQRSSLVEGLRMYTAYTNNIGAHFDNHFRRATNTLLRIRQRKAGLIRQRQQEGVDNEVISSKVYEQITLLAKQFKEILVSRIVDPSSIKPLFQNPIYNQALQRLTPILTSYPVRYTFEQNNTYYDAKANPCEHMMTFYQLACLFEALRLPIFNCFPLCRTWIPGYTTIDSKILLAIDGLMVSIK